MPTAPAFDPAPRVWAVVAATCLGASTGAASAPTQATLNANANANASANATGDPVCPAPRSRDDVTLHVSTTAAYGSTHTLKIDVSWADTAAANGSAQNAGFKVSNGDTEGHDAQVNWSGNGFRGRWAIKESATCEGEVTI